MCESNSSHSLQPNSAEVLARSVTSLYEGVDSELLEEFEVKVGMLQGSVLSPFLFAGVVDVVTEFARECVLSELLYTDDLVLMSETIEGLWDNLIKWKEAFESNRLKVILFNTKVMVSGGITKDGTSKSKVDLLLESKVYLSFVFTVQ